MKINHAFILCAGFGKRLNPITLEIPKPLIKINKITLLENTIRLLEKLEIQTIKINTFYLGEQIKEFLKKFNSKLNIEIIEDGDQILDTGGGIYNLSKSIDQNDFIVFNPDTIWNANDIPTIKNMINFYFSNKLSNSLLVVNKNKSFDKRFKGDFELNNNKLLKQSENNFIYTGCQILNKVLFKNINNKVFSITDIWNSEVNKNTLNGFESNNDFIHITDTELYHQINR
tara:strand:- start:1379 stop:2065 length:687 start_codon:yes stop_codon:yes gene_type:complete